VLFRSKLVCYNICCVNQEAHELGIDPGIAVNYRRQAGP